jgi:hypothetical protein
MKRREFLSNGAPTLGGALLTAGNTAAERAAPGPSAQDDGWITLFNGRDLSGWYTFLPSTGKNNDPKKVFKVEQGMIHILDLPVTSENQEFGYLASEQEYSNCRIAVEFKWGTKRFPPRAETKRDNGLIYYIVGPDKVWPTCLECQIQETDFGDLWILGGAVVTPGRGGRGRNGGTAIPVGPGAAPPTPQSRGRIFKDGDFEDRTGWNTVEVIIDEDRTTQLVNGRIVNAGHDAKQPDPDHPGQLISLTRGRIALQAEGAEAWYRSVKVKPINR